MRRSLAVLLTAGFVLAASPACGPSPDLHTLKLTTTMTGWVSDDPTEAGENRLVPSITFELTNQGPLPINNVDLSLAFWAAGKDGETDSKQIRGIASDALEPGATSDTITVHSNWGAKSYYPPQQFFSRPEFLDFTIKVFAKRNGKTVKLGEIPVERRLVPAARKDGPRP